MSIIDLGGHSGCQIFLIEEDDGTVFVRKTSRDRAYNQRLKVQSEKQASFSGDIVRAPKVLNCGYSEDGRFYFDMEYVQGITLAEYIKTMEIGKIKGVVQSLVDSIVPKALVAMREEESSVVQIFRDKLTNLRGILKGNNNNIIDRALDLLDAHDWSKLTASPCHGDMTLENIIVKDDRLYFIDFLDSFYDSWFLDIGTLLQDVQVMWSYRFQKNISMNTILRLIVFRDLLLDEVKKIDPNYTLEIYYALLQKLVRIYPYTKDAFTYRYLDEKITQVLDRINIMEQKEGLACER